MNSRWLTMLLVAVIIGAALGLGYQQASGKTALLAGAHPEYSLDSPTPEPNPVDAQIAPIDELVSADAIVTSSITYQGALKENGAAVTGSRQMTFRLYSATDCSAGLLATQGPQAVSVKDGLFNVVLNFSSMYFTGEGRALRVDVAGTRVGCHPLYPTPYALSLRPGAWIEGSNEGSITLTAKNTSTQSGSFGIQGISDAPDGGGLGGVSWSAQGHGAYVANMGGGEALHADGKIYSSSDSVLWLSPYSIVLRDNTGNVTLTPQGDGSMFIDNFHVDPTYSYIALPISTLGTQFGSPMYVKSLEVCYRTNDTRGDTRIVLTQVVKGLIAPAGFELYLTDDTERNSTTLTCYSVSADSPRKPIDGSSWVQFTAFMPDLSGIYIYRVKLTITERQD